MNYKETQKRYSGIQLETDDLVQEALIGVLRAVKTYDPETGNLFLTYAQTTAENAMLDYVRKCASAIPASGSILSLDAPPPGLDSEARILCHETTGFLGFFLILMAIYLSFSICCNDHCNRSRYVTETHRLLWSHYHFSSPSPPINRVISSIRSSGNGGDDTGFMAWVCLIVILLE